MSSPAVTPATEALRALLRQWRVEAGTPGAKKIAETSGLPLQTVNDALDGTRLPPWPAVERIGLLFGRALNGDFAELRTAYDAAADELPPPSRPEPEKPEMSVLVLPVAPGVDVHLTLPRLLTQAEWQQMQRVLDAMKTGLTAPAEEEPT